MHPRDETQRAVARLVAARSDKRPGAAIGFAVKSGWASAVVLTRRGDTLSVADSAIVALADPDDPDARQPYHAGFGTARAAGARLAGLLASVRRFGAASMSRLMRGYEAGHDLRGAGIVVGSTTDPRSIAHDHIRIHALEGPLFRGIVQAGAAKRGLRCSTWRERDLYPFAQTSLGRSDQALRKSIADLGRDVAAGWRSEQKAAALAAWLVLDGHHATAAT